MQSELNSTLYRSGQQQQLNQNNNNEQIVQQVSIQNNPKIKILSKQLNIVQMENYQQKVQEFNTFNQGESANISNKLQANNHQEYDKNQSSDLLSTNTSSQNSLNMTIMRTQYLTCHYCHNTVQDQTFLLACQHRFHIYCLQELIKTQFYNKNIICQCLCQTKISQKILRQFYTSSELDEYFSNHLFQILQKYTFLLKKKQFEKFDYSDYSQLIYEAKNNNRENIQQ